VLQGAVTGRRRHRDKNGGKGCLAVEGLWAAEVTVVGAEAWVFNVEFFRTGCLNQSLIPKKYRVLSNK
jgi:hypothetical protein